MNRSKQAGMAIKTIVVLLVGLALAFIHLAEAQQSKKAPQIAYLSASSASSQAPRLDAFRQGPRELGYVEGKNIVIESRYAEEKQDRLRELAAELVGLKVDVILTAGPTATRAGKEATGNLPVVMVNVGDPVGLGFVASLARPGGNVTGLSIMILGGKRLDLLKETIPNRSRVTIVWNVTNPGSTEGLKEAEITAPSLGLKVQPLELRSRDDLDNVFMTATKGRAEALMILGNPVAFSYRRRLVDLAAKNRLPAMYLCKRVYGGWWSDVVCAKYCRAVPARRYIRRQNPERREARRSSCRAANKVRADHQSKDGEADRPDNSAECAGKGGQGD